jgi:hypothetical protein
MGISVFPAAGGSPIKSIQRGYAASALTVAISAVNMAKTMVRSFADAASGTVAATGTIAAYNISNPLVDMKANSSPGSGYSLLPSSNYTQVRMQLQSSTSSAAATTISGGTTNLAAKTFGAQLATSTTLTTTGACYWEVVEYN